MQWSAVVMECPVAWPQASPARPPVGILNTLRLTRRSLEIGKCRDIGPDLCCSGSSDRLQSLHPADFTDLFCVRGPRCVLDFVLKLTPPGLSRWNQVFALLNSIPTGFRSRAKTREPPGQARWGLKTKPRLAVSFGLQLGQQRKRHALKQQRISTTRAAGAIVPAAGGSHLCGDQFAHFECL